MITTLTSPKPGSGTSTTAALLALAVRLDTRTHVVDLCGDQAALFNTDTHPGAVEVAERLTLHNLADATEADQCATICRLAQRDEHVIFDAGSPDRPILDRLPAATIYRWALRLRCYLALRRVGMCTRRPDEVVLLAEIGRALTAVDVEAVASAPVVATIAIHPLTARLIEAGLLTGRVPRGVHAQLAALAQRTKAVG